MFLVCCIVLRVFEGVGAAGYSAASFGFVGELFPEKMSSVIGFLEIVIGVGLTAGPAVGGFLYDWGGYGLPFYCVGVTILAATLLGFIVLPPPTSTKICEAEEDNNEKKSSWEVLKITPILIVALLTVVFSISWGYKFATLEPHLREFNLPVKQVGLFFLIPSALYAISGPIFGYFVDKMERPWWCLVAGLLLTAFGLCILGPSPLIGIQNSIWSNVVALAIVGVAASMAMIPCFKTMIGHAVQGGYPEGAAICGLVGGIWNSSFFLGEVIGPVFGAFLTDVTSFATCSDVIAAMCLTYAVFLLVYFQFIHKNSSKQEFVLPKC